MIRVEFGETFTFLRENTPPWDECCFVSSDDDTEDVEQEEGEEEEEERSIAFMSMDSLLFSSILERLLGGRGGLLLLAKLKLASC